MVYKSKKINKRRYLKRQSRKKMYGGEHDGKYYGMKSDDVKSNVVKSNVENKDEKNNTVVNNDTTKNNENENQGTSLFGNAKKVANIGLGLGNNIAATGLDLLEDGVKYASEGIGIDTNKSVVTEINKIASTLQSPEAQKALVNLGKIVSEVSEDVVAPSINKIADKVIEHSGEMAEQAIKAGVKGASAVPVVGAVLGVPGAIGNVIEAAQHGAELAAEVSGQTVDAAKQLNEEKGKIEEAYGNVMDVINNGNEMVSTTLDSFGQIVDEQGKSIIAEQNGQTGGRLLKKIKKSSEIISDRIIQAQLEFLTPATISSQMQQYYKNNYKTRRRRIKNNRLSRKR